MLMYQTNRIIITAEADVFSWKKAELYGFERKPIPTNEGGIDMYVERNDGPSDGRSQAGNIILEISIQCNGELKRIHQCITIWDSGDEISFDRTTIHTIVSVLQQLGYGFKKVNLEENIENFVAVSFNDINHSYPFYDKSQEKE